MDSNQINFWLSANVENFNPADLPAIKAKLEELDSNQLMMLQSAVFKKPSTIFLIALLLGWERFFLDDITLGIVKVITGYGCGIWWLIDIFSSKKRAQKYNFQQFTKLTGMPVVRNTGGTAPVPTFAEIPTGSRNQNTATNSNSGSETFYTSIPQQSSSSDFFASVPEFLKEFIKKPFITVSEKPLSFSDSLLFAGVHALLFAFLVLAIGSDNRELMYLIGAKGNGADLFILTLLLSLLGTGSLTLLYMLFGKMIFKGESADTQNGNFQKLLGQVVSTEVPLIAVTLLAIPISFSSVGFTLALLLFGIFATVALSNAVFTQEYKLSPDKSALATIFTYTAQVVVMAILVSILF